MVAGKIFYVSSSITPPYLAAPGHGHGHGSAPLHNLTSRRRQEIKMERQYANPLSQYWGPHHDGEYYPSESDSSTEADHDDDMGSPSSGASSSPLSSILPSSHGQPESNSSETPQCATTRSDGETTGRERRSRGPCRPGRGKCIYFSIRLCILLTDI